MKIIVTNGKSKRSIIWNGNNLKELIDTIGKHPKFDDWFKSWDEYEEYVHQHGDIFRLYQYDDGGYYEIQKGCEIRKDYYGKWEPVTEGKYKFIVD